MEFAEYRLEFKRVCPDAVESLEFTHLLPASILRHGIEILRTLPDGAGFEAFFATWHAFVDANPSALAASGLTYDTDFIVAVDGGEVIGPPAAPITVDDYYRALLLTGMSEEDARQIADDFAPSVGRPGVMWVGDTLLYVALLSRGHEERMREYLKLDPLRMGEELDRVRRALVDRESPGSTDREQAT